MANLLIWLSMGAVAVYKKFTRASSVNKKYMAYVVVGLGKTVHLTMY